MAKLVWDETGKRLYETGVDRCVLYLQDTKGEYTGGEAWNGLMSVSESPSGADETALYANNGKYLGLRAKEEFGGTIGAYTTPDSWAKCDGSISLAKGLHIGQQSRQTFGLCYRTLIGNDVKKDDYGYKLHIVYGATASPSEREFSTVNDSPEAVELSYEFTTTDVNITGAKPASHMEIVSTECDAEKLKKLEDILYGSETTEARLPLPDEIISILGAVEDTVSETE